MFDDDVNHCHTKSHHLIVVMLRWQITDYALDGMLICDALTFYRPKKMCTDLFSVWCLLSWKQFFEQQTQQAVVQINKWKREWWTVMTIQTFVKLFACYMINDKNTFIWRASLDSLSRPFGVCVRAVIDHVLQNRVSFVFNFKASTHMCKCNAYYACVFRHTIPCRWNNRPLNIAKWQHRTQNTNDAL